MPAKAARTIAVPKVTRDAKLDASIARLKTVIARNKTTLDGLPPKASRTNAQQKNAQQCKDDIDRDRLLLLIVGGADATDLADSTGVE